jgi:hypothetical protein
MELPLGCSYGQIGYTYEPEAATGQAIYDQRVSEALRRIQAQRPASLVRQRPDSDAQGQRPGRARNGQLSRDRQAALYRDCRNLHARECWNIRPAKETSVVRWSPEDRLNLGDNFVAWPSEAVM